MSKPMIRPCAGDLAGPHRADHAARRPDRIASLPWNRRASVSPPRRLHEHQLAGHVAVEGRRHPVDVAPQDRRQIGVDDGGVAAADHLHQRADPVADRDLREARRPRELRRPRLVLPVAVAVHEDDGAGVEPRRLAPRPAPPASARLVERHLHRRRPPAPARAPRSPRHRASPAARSAGRTAAAGAGRRAAAARPSPCVVTSTTGSPLRSSSALVATVVPILTLATRAAGIARVRRPARGSPGSRAAPRPRSAPGSPTAASPGAAGPRDRARRCR